MPVRRYEPLLIDRVILALVALLCALTPSGSALALPTFPAEITPARLGPFDCATCHLTQAGATGCGTPPATPKCLAPVGVDFQRARGSGLSTLAVWQSVDDLDSDGDGYTTYYELLNTTLATQPNDPSVRPCGTGCATGQACSCPPRAGTTGAFPICQTTPTIAQCREIDDCASNPCRVQGACSDRTNGYQCSCPAGYRLEMRAAGAPFCDPDSCISSPCTPGTCTDATNGYTCSCPSNYQVRLRTGVAYCDRNACATFPCGQGANCSDQPDGSGQEYVCGGCPTGYSVGTGSNGQQTCLNTNDCPAMDPCAPGACSDDTSTISAYLCACPRGFSVEGTQSPRCVNVNECAAAVNPCGANTRCEDRIPSTGDAPPYTCTCLTGFRDNSGGQGTRCDNIDECAENLDTCHPSARCTDLTPSTGGLGYACACIDGFRDTSPATPGRSCESVDECTEPEGSPYRHDCSSNAICENRIPAAQGQPSFVCTCRVGYQDKSPAGRSGIVCEDIDECGKGATLPNNCSAKAACINKPGTYECKCGAGFMGNGTTCVDAQECKQRNHDCDPNAQCADAAGSYQCLCKPGYTGNGRTSGTGCKVRCGDGQVGPDESCDDGNSADGDGCNTKCAIETRWACSYDEASQKSRCAQTCGDGIVQKAFEECDRGPDNSDSKANACRKTCTRPRCGDGVVDTSEECDESAANSDSGSCTTGCLIPKCGNERVDPGEACDGSAGLPCTERCELDKERLKPGPELERSTEAAVVPRSHRERGCSLRPTQEGTGGTASWLLGLLATLLIRRERRTLHSNG